MRAQSSLSTEYVPFKVTATNVDGTPIDPSQSQAKMAFVGVGQEPVEADWHDATWFGGNTAAVLVGPDNGGVLLADGTYSVWLRILANPERPTGPVGLLRIT